jgi:hypothetical protein
VFAVISGTRDLEQAKSFSGMEKQQSIDVEGCDEPITFLKASV